MNILNKSVQIVIPTYKREVFNAEQLIKNNPDVIFTLAVRRDAFVNGFYNRFIKTYSNIKFMLLDNVWDIGSTRQRIVELATNNNVDYLMMLDDTTYRMYDYFDDNIKFIDIITKSVKRFETDKLANISAAFIYARRYKDFRLEYFGSQLCQVFMLNLNVLNKYKLNFRPNSECGIEDLCLYTEIAMKGLVVLSDKTILRQTDTPCRLKSGGTHIDEEQTRITAMENYSKKFDFFEEWFKSTYDKKGSHLLTFVHNYHKKWHAINHYAYFNINVAYNALILNRKDNQHCIDNAFLKSKCKIFKGNYVHLD